MKILENNNYTAYKAKSMFLKTLLIPEYVDSIGFHVRKKELFNM